MNDGEVSQVAEPDGRPPAPVLILDGITKRFGGVIACDNVSMTFGARSVTAVAGNNGAGKSTILRIISGAQSPDGGQIIVGGRSVRLRSVRAAREIGIETVPQELALVSGLDVATNMFLGRELTHGPRWIGPLARKSMERRAREVIADLGSTIPDFRTKVGAMSGGQQQAVAIARAVGWGRSVIVLDEPTAALGVHETNQVEQTILRMKSLGLAVILVSHDIEQIFRVADRAYVMYHGRLCAEENIKSSTRERLVRLITSGHAEHGSSRRSATRTAASENDHGE